MLKLNIKAPGAAERRSAMASARKDLLTGGITLAAILMFGFTGSAVLPVALKALSGFGAGADRVLVTALLLNLALIVFGWRRCHDLQVEVFERKAAEERAWLLASRDPLTGFLNRRSLTDTANQLINAPDGHPPAVLLLVDLDHFKDVNDLHGHATGDALLRSVAQAIGCAVPEGTTCVRLGGDEFAILLIGEAAAPERANETAERILRRIETPVEVEGIFAHTGASIGLAPMDGSGIEALLRRADIAMYEAKKAGRGRFAWFDESMESELRRRSLVEAGARAGIPAGEFIPYYEQQIDLLTGELHGFEVLARWNHPERGIVEPAEFIPVTEASGLISDLSTSVIRQALIEARHWDERLTLSINISPVQLKDPLLAQRLVQLLVETGFPAGRLEIEITESSLFENLGLAKTTIESLKNQGIRISLDDFGTGYSSLAHLQALPFDRIKIDRSFVASMRGNADSSAIVSVIAKLGGTLGLPVTAEGIEDADTWRILQALGCINGQGWHFGKPIPADEVRALLGRHPDMRLHVPPLGTVTPLASRQPIPLSSAVEELIAARTRIAGDRHQRYGS